MAIRVDIDEQDLQRLHNETGKRVNRRTIILSASCAIIAAAAAAAGAAAWRSFQVLADARMNAAPLREPAAALGVSVVLIAAVIFIGALLFKARRKLRAATRRERVKHGLTVGRFEFFFTDKALIKKGAKATRKIRWAGLDRIAETKSNIVFWRRGEVFAFMPKDGLADPALYEKLVRIHGPAISSKLSCREDAGANPHKIAFECTKQDYDEYRRLYADRFDGPLAVFRQTFQWPAWPPVLLFFSLAAAGLAAYGYVATLNLAAGAVALTALFSAVLIFILNGELFRGPAHPFRKGARWPYAQSELISITLFKSGVCVTRGDGEEIYPWTVFERFVNCPLTAYLMLTPQTVLPAPKRAFLDKVHFQAFANYARAQINAAQKQTAAHRSARLTRGLSPGAKKASAPKALPARRAAKALPRNPAPKALPPAAAPKAAPGKKAKGSAIDAVRIAAKARAAALS